VRGELSLAAKNGKIKSGNGEGGGGGWFWFNLEGGGVGLGLRRAGVMTWGHAAGGEGRHGVEGSGGWDAGAVRAGLVVGLRGKGRVVS
jgi:hypothetical protein